MSPLLAAAIFVGYLTLAWVLAGLAGRFFGLNTRVPAPPAAPKRRQVELDLDDVEWDWRRESA